MKKFNKIILITGAILLAVGFILSAVMIPIAITQSKNNFVEKIFECENEIEQVVLSVTNGDVEIKKTDKEKAYVEARYDEVTSNVTFSQDNATLTLVDEIKRFVNSWNWESPTYTVYIPIKDCVFVDIKGVNGKITVNEGSFKDLNIDVTNGLITVKNTTCDNDISVKTVNGAVYVDNVTATAGSIKVESVNGMLKINNAVAIDNLLNFKTTSGLIEISDTQSKVLSCVTHSGAVNVSRIKADGIKIRTSVGAINCSIAGNPAEYVMCEEEQFESILGEGKKVYCLKTNVGSKNCTFVS